MPSQPSAKVILDSISPANHRLTTMEVVMHRFVLAEFNTHRVFSRNSASSRAIPVAKMIERVETDPAVPLYWGKNQKGMQADEELGPGEQDKARECWDAARECALFHARNLLDVGVHKQIANRLLEPFLWHTAIVSSTQWVNFLAQRCSPLAMPEIQAVAFAMQAAIAGSKPTSLQPGEWHTPYIQTEELDLSMNARKNVSTARCARVSYLTHDGKRDWMIDNELFNKLSTATPPHASPFEHVATPLPAGSSSHGNFAGWEQYRYEVFGEMNSPEKHLWSKNSR